MMASLTAFDIIVLLLIGVGGLVGLFRGFVSEVLSLLAWVAGIFAVRLLFAPAKIYVLRFVENDAGAGILTFALLFLSAYIGFRYIAQMLGSRTRASIVGPVDRLLGLGFGAFKGLIGAAILFLLLTLGLDLIGGGGPRPAWLQAGRTGPLLEMTSKAMVDFIEDARKPDTTAIEPAEATKPGSRPISKKPDGYQPADRGALDALLGTAK